MKALAGAIIAIAAAPICAWHAPRVSALRDLHPGAGQRTMQCWRQCRGAIPP
jgi:hypothetical protein